MASESFQTKRIYSLISNAKSIRNLSAYIAKGMLAAGDDLTRAGHVLTQVGKVTVATPETHHLLTRASTYNAGANLCFSFAGICLGPVVEPENYDLDDTIDDGTEVYYLRPTGGLARVRSIYHDVSGDVLPGQWLGLSSTAGELMLTLFDLSTPNVAELAAALGALSERVGISASAVADNDPLDLIVDIWF